MTDVHMHVSTYVNVHIHLKLHTVYSRTPLIRHSASVGPRGAHYSENAHNFEFRCSSECRGNINF